MRIGQSPLRWLTFDVVRLYWTRFTDAQLNTEGSNVDLERTFLLPRRPKIGEHLDLGDGRTAEVTCVIWRHTGRVLLRLGACCADSKKELRHEIARDRKLGWKVRKTHGFTVKKKSGRRRSASQVKRITKRPAAKSRAPARRKRELNGPAQVN